MADMKRIFYITTTTRREGPGNQLGAMLEQLDRQMFEPTVVTILGGGEWDTRFRELGVKRINLGMPKPFDLLAPIKILLLFTQIPTKFSFTAFVLIVVLNPSPVSLPLT